MGKLLLLLQLLLMFLCSGLGQKGLDCENNMHRNITCTWNGTWQSTGLPVNPQSKCWIVCQSCPDRPTWDLGKDRRCTLQMNTTFSLIRLYSLSYDLNVMCENHTDPVAKLQGYTPRNERVRLSPLERPAIVNSTVSWPFAHCILEDCPYLHAEYLIYELQQKARGQEWKVVPTNKGSTSSLLDEEELVRGEWYWFRVRVKPNIPENIPKAEWSEWSAEATWVSAVGRPPASPQQGLLKEDEVESWLVWWAAGGALAVLVFLVGIMFLGTRILKASLIPTPSKYFDGLDSVYKGNFKAWLGSILTLDALGVEVLTEYTSPVEVIKKEPGKPCKSFSNKQYFQEEPQKTALLPSPLPFFEEESLEPCKEFSPYDDMGKDCVGFGLQRVNTGVDQDGCQSDITDCSVAERTITMAMTTTTISTTTSCSSSSSCGTSCSSSSSCGTSSSSGISSMSGSINTSTTTSSSEKHGSISWSCSTVPNIGISCSAGCGSSTSGGNVSISSSSASTDGGSSSCTASSSISCSSSSSGVSCTSGSNFSRLRMDLVPIQVCNDYESFTRLVHAGPQSPDSGVCMGSGEEDSREEEEGGMKGPWRTGFSQPSLQPLVHPCTVPYSGETGVDPVGPNLCSTPTGWSPHKQNPLDTYGQLQPCSDDYQPLKAT